MSVLDQGDVPAAVHRPEVGLHYAVVGAEPGQPQLARLGCLEFAGQIGVDETVIPAVVDQRLARNGREFVGQLPSWLPDPQRGVDASQPDHRHRGQPRPGDQVGHHDQGVHAAGDLFGEVLLRVHDDQRRGGSLRESTHAASLLGRGAARAAVRNRPSGMPGWGIIRGLLQNEVR
ncbi:hypothetical protein SDC9_171172 [bioreactor metagenome]|uniref:Uncharacterized protein n=1 Tax=bioreactor metagenome TaxID=1076179 RepID=A0A645GDD8_9ZZZZ